MIARTVVLLFAVLMLGAAPGALAQATVTSDAGSDLFVAGGSVRVSRPVGGDLFAAGGSVDVDSAVGGDAVVAGGNVRIGAAVANSLYSAGGQLVIDAPVGRNARIAGGQVSVERRAQIAGNVSIAGGQVKIAGRVNGYLRAGGGNVVIDGPVDGDVIVTAGKIELGPQARIGGNLRYFGRDELVRDPAAQVLGSIERMPFAARAPVEEPPRAIGRGVGWVWTIGLVLIAAVLAAALPLPARRVANALRQRPALSLLVGFVAFVCIPVAVLILLLTVIGIPMALLAAVLYLALLLIGYVGTGIGVGQWALDRFGPALAGRRGWSVAAAAAGMLAVALLGRVPWVGVLIMVVALFAGIGALFLAVRQPQSG